MSDSNSTLKILSNLNIIATLTIGKTLSTTSMQVIDHNSWATSIWRKYRKENRAITIDKIKEIINDGMSILESLPSEEIITSLINALNGFETLADTYKSDYYTENNIRNFLVASRERMANNKLSSIDNAEPDEIIAIIVQETLRDELLVNNMAEESIDQPFRICAQSDSTLQFADESRLGINSSGCSTTCDVECEITFNNDTTFKISKISQEFITTPLVETSDRASYQTANKTTIISTNGDCSTKIVTNLSSNSINAVNKEFNNNYSNKKKSLIERNKRLQNLTHATHHANSPIKEHIHTSDKKHDGRYYH